MTGHAELVVVVVGEEVSVEVTGGAEIEAGWEVVGVGLGFAEDVEDVVILVDLMALLLTLFAEVAGEVEAMEVVGEVGLLAEDAMLLMLENIAGCVAEQEDTVPAPY